MTESRPLGQVQEEILSTVRKSQAAVVDAIQTWAGAVQSITPSRPELNVPFADKLPRPQDLVASAYDFAEQLLASQRTFAEDVLKATGSLLPAPHDAPAKKAGAAAK
ncbi:MAG: hypothetical protein M3Y33_14760 [Actinomycetota bacterium]|nr:hypothetical protein [Actinomycetota bacterium]